MFRARLLYLAAIPENQAVQEKQALQQEKQALQQENARLMAKLTELKRLALVAQNAYIELEKLG